jgi:hypothetical protein
MNYILFTFLLLAFTAPTYAQISTPIELITKDGVIVILRPDGTWDFKKSAPQSAPIPAANLGKSEVSTDSLPPNFIGIDPKTLHTRLINLKENLVKNEFETSAQYERRIAEEIQKPIIDNLTIRDNFSFVISDIQAQYNADTQKMLFSLRVEKSRMVESRRNLEKQLGRKLDLGRADRLDYTNLYSIESGDTGVRHDAKFRIFFDKVNELSFTKNNNSDVLSIEVNLEADEARRLKSAAKVVVVVKLDRPYTEAYSFGHRFQVQPIEAYFFDPQKGTILGGKIDLRK